MVEIAKLIKLTRVTILVEQKNLVDILGLIKIKLKVVFPSTERLQLTEAKV